MKIFNLTLSQMLMMFILIVVGMFLRKKKLIPETAGTTLAKLETFLFVPALSIYTQMTRCTIKSFKENSILLLYGLIIVIAAILISYPLSKLFIKKSELPEKQYEKNVFKYAVAFGNYGFVGNFIILGVWGEELFYKYSLFCVFVSVLCSSWGLFTLIPKDHDMGVWQKLKKGLITPPLIALIFGILIGLSGISEYMPDFVVSVFDNAGKCQGPVAMVLAGIVIGGYEFKGLLKNKKVYVMTFLRLIVIPAVLMVILKLLGTNDEIMILSLIAFAAPIGLNVIVYPAAYGGDTKVGASMAMISHALSVVTIPLMYLLFIEIL